jgi:hypothetical protein
MQGSNSEMREVFAKRTKNVSKEFEKKQTRNMRSKRQNRHVFDE